MSLIQKRIQQTGLTLRYNTLEDGRKSTLLELIGISALMVPSATNPSYASGVNDTIKLFSTIIGVPESFVNESTCGLCATLPIPKQSLLGLLENALAANRYNHQHLYRIASYHRDESFRSFLEGGLSSGSWDVRCQALYGLSLLEGQQSTKGIASLLSDGDVDVAMDALSALCRTGALASLVETGELDKYLSGDHASTLQEALPYMLDQDLDVAESIFGFSGQEQTKIRLLASGARSNEDLYIYLLEKFQAETSNNIIMLEAIVNSAPEMVEPDPLMEMLDSFSEGGWYYSATQILLGLLPLSDDAKIATADLLLSKDISDYDAKRSRAIAVSNLDPSRFSECSEKIPNLLTFGYARLESMFRFPDKFPIFNDMFGHLATEKQRQLWATTMVENNWGNDLINMLGAALGSVYPESMAYLERKAFERNTNGTVRRAAAVAVLLSPNEVGLHPVLIRCLISSEFGGPVETSPENIGLLLALLDDSDVYEAAADLLRAAPAEVRGIVRAFSDFKEQVNNTSNGLKKAGLTVGGVPQNYQNSSAYTTAIEEHPILGLAFKEKLPTSAIQSLINNPETANQVVGPILLDNDDREKMKAAAQVIGGAASFSADQLSDFFMALANHRSWVNREVAGVLLQHAGAKVLESSKVDQLEAKLVELTQDNDSDVTREAKKAADVLGVEYA